MVGRALSLLLSHGVKILLVVAKRMDVIIQGEATRQQHS